ncbi:hypothetical protein QTP88_025683 [Uroleucon formosanum]
MSNVHTQHHSAMSHEDTKAYYIPYLYIDIVYNVWDIFDEVSSEGSLAAAAASEAAWDPTGKTARAAMTASLVENAFGRLSLAAAALSVDRHCSTVVDPSGLLTLFRPVDDAQNSKPNFFSTSNSSKDTAHQSAPNQLNTAKQACYSKNNNSTASLTILDKYPLPDHIKALIRQKRKARAKWQLTGYPNDKRTFNNLINKLKRQLQNHKNQTYDTFISNLDPSNGSLWKATKRILNHNVFAEHLATVFMPNDIQKVHSTLPER